MNLKTKTIATGNIFDPALEEMIKKRDIELKELARKNAKHFARRNLPLTEGDDLSQYTGDIRAGYEKLAADIFHHLQPASQFPEAKADAEYYREKDKQLEEELKTKEAQNLNDQFELHDFHQGTIPARIKWAIISTVIITIGEILYNTKAFQITGENLLFALILSICISFAVFVFSHMTPLLIKSAKNKIQRIVISAGAFVLVSGIFTALAIFRSNYLAAHDVHINPFYFVIINLFFFIVSSLLSFFVLPTWAEIKQNAHSLKLYYAIKKRKKEIKNIKAEREKIKEIILERTKVRIRVAHYSNYIAEIIRKMYLESIEIFKTTNLTYRAERRVPDCFAKMHTEADIQDFQFTLLIPEKQEQ
jgi:cell division protein FtsB